MRMNVSVKVFLMMDFKAGRRESADRVKERRRYFRKLQRCFDIRLSYTFNNVAISICDILYTSFSYVFDLLI